MTRATGRTFTYRDLTPDAFVGEIPRGRWFRVSQEVVLNDVGVANGVIRVWLDGALVIEKERLTIRSNPATLIGTVKADVHYSARDTEWLAAPSETAVGISQVVVRN